MTGTLSKVMDAEVERPQVTVTGSQHESTILESTGTRRERSGTTRRSGDSTARRLKGDRCDRHHKCELGGTGNNNKAECC